MPTVDGNRGFAVIAGANNCGQVDCPALRNDSEALETNATTEGFKLASHHNQKSGLF